MEKRLESLPLEGKVSHEVGRMRWKVVIFPPLGLEKRFLSTSSVVAAGSLSETRHRRQLPLKGKPLDNQSMISNGVFLVQ